MSEFELYKLLNERFGEMYQLMLAGDAQAASAILEQLVRELEANNGV